ncbi:hypothetical protein [Methanobrevibacter sp. DSM 116169]|uniref:hypothetical protein n=1 Tax=Methanobrevibacter sp. DSM 116169 TaxID=3242727 RepID=UPI0038FCA48A
MDENDTFENINDEIKKDFSNIGLNIIKQFRENFCSECLLYFDYETGKATKKFYPQDSDWPYVYGTFSHINTHDIYKPVSEKKIASIHNHPTNFAFPSQGDLSNLLRYEFLDYAIITSLCETWVLKFKGSLNGEELLNIQERHKNILSKFKKTTSSIFDNIEKNNDEKINLNINNNDFPFFNKKYFKFLRYYIENSLFREEVYEFLMQLEKKYNISCYRIIHPDFHNDNTF